MRETSLQECINILQNEKENKLSSRFPCRAILTHSRQSYENLIQSLSYLCDRTVSSSELFKGADIFPAYDTLFKQLKGDEWVLLPGVSEYLRLFHASEQYSERFSRLWNQIVDSSSKARIIIPLWNCDALWHDKSIGLEYDIRQDENVFSLDDCEGENESLSIEEISK